MKDDEKHQGAEGNASGGQTGAGGGENAARRRRRWLLRLFVPAFVILAIALIYVSNLWLTERFNETTRNRANLRLALYTGNLLSELKRSSIVPRLLARDPALIGALNSGDFSQSSSRLIEYLDEIGVKSLMLLDHSGRVVAASDRNLLGAVFRNSPFFIEALRGNDTVFTVSESQNGGLDFAYSRKMEVSGKSIGVIVAMVDLGQFESAWAGISDAVMVTDSEGRIILSTEPKWRGLKEEEALALRSPPSAIQRAIQATTDWAMPPADAYISGKALMRQEKRIPFRGWTITSFTNYASVRERVNAVLALEIMAFAVLIAMGFYLMSRRAVSRSRIFQRESAELRALNQRLQQEIAERKRAEKHLEVAEQSLAQSSKLAALGEMSAAVSHELNQPLAAMKTYLAGARLLLRRKRAEEAVSAFQRIDDLIERMGAITRQLKSYARKGSDQLEPLDARHAVDGAIAMMEPQLRQRNVKITRTLPREPVIVLADRVRLEQVIVNLLRNALDATKGVKDPQVDILLARGDMATISVRDNGTGIENLESLFEPFYTTKQPGDGVGLGLAISSGIVNDFGGRLTARNAQGGGALFEVTLPLAGEAEGEEGAGGMQAAE